MTAITVVQAKENGSFVLSLPRASVAQVDFADIDLVIKTFDGHSFVLPGAGLAAMEKNPPRVVFSDGAVQADQLLATVGSVDDPTLNTHTFSSDKTPTQEQEDTSEQKEKLEEELNRIQHKLEQQQKDLAEAQHKLAQQEHAVEKTQAIEKELAEAKEQIEQQDQDKNETLAETKEHEAAKDMAAQMQKIAEELHSKDFDYTPPREYQPPPAPFAGPAGVPAPISMTPLVLLSMGNVVGTQTDTSVPGVTTIYGGGGPDGSDATAKLGPRDALQFASATINGTAGNDIIYAEGPLVGNANPAVDTSMYSKQFLLNVAGYFTKLSDIVFTGLPSYVSVTGATLQADGSWVLPSAVVIAQQTFELVYDKDAWRGGANYFDMTVVVSGEMRNTTFTSTEKFRFEFMDVTTASQSTNPYLTFWDEGQNKQIYILPTQDQPNTITAGAGDDMIYGGRSHDTIDAGDGNDVVWAYGGDNIITGGDGNDQITAGDGANQITGGLGNDTILAGNGNNIVDAGDGTNSVTVGSGNNSITGGSGDDTITTGDGMNTVHAGDGVNTITTGAGADTITSGSGGDIINAGAGNNTINAGDGNNQITTGSGNDTITVGAGNSTINAGDGINIITTGNGNNTITTGIGADTITLGTGTNWVSSSDGNDFLYGGAGDDTLLGGAGDDLLRGGLGTNVLNGGTGTNTVDYTGMGVGVTASLLAGTASAVGMSETLTLIQNVTGSALNDTITGDATANILIGAAGNDTIVGGGGNDTIQGGDGNDTLTGGAGNDAISGGSGDDTINGGGAGADVLSGGDGNDIFTNPSMNTVYDGGTGVDKVDYSGSAVNLIIDLSAGTGYTGAAQMASYTSIEWIVSGSGSDTLTGGSGNDILDGGAGMNTLIGGTGSNYYYMGVGVDYVQANGAANWDQVEYYGTPSAVVVNLDNVAHSFVNTLGATVNVAALSGTSRGETAADTASWSIGDTYTDGGVDYLYTGNSNDVLWGGAGNEQFMAQGGDDYIYAAAGNDFVYMSTGNDRIDAGLGIDRFCTSWYGNNVTVYLDGYADINANGTADYLEKGAAVLGGSAYTGFANGVSGVTLFTGFEDLMGGSGSDFLVGDAANNEINAYTGNNTMYGLDGDDLIFSHAGNNTIDGGLGNDTVSFRSEGLTGSHGYNSATSVEIYLLDTDLDNNGAMDRAATWGSYTAFTARTNLSGVYSYSSITNVENINGSINADKIAGDANANIIHADSGNDIISGNGGADLLYGENGNDTFVVNAAHLATLSLASGGAGTDTLMSSGWSFAAGSLYTDNAKYANIEVVDVRNSVAGEASIINAYDIQSMVDTGATSVLQLNMDVGDTLTTQIGAGTGALSVLNTTHTGTDDVFKFYSDAGHIVNNSTNLVAIVNVHYGA